MPVHSCQTLTTIASCVQTQEAGVILTANNQNLTYVTTNPSVNYDYDGAANYTYGEGEDMYFSCNKAYNENLQLGSDALRLEYYNAKGFLLFQTKPRVGQSHFFRSVLKSNNDKYYLDCIRAAGDPEREYRYRTTFYMKKRDLYADADHHAMILTVNGQKLTVITNNSKSSDSYDNYLYRYIEGEVLNVTCRKTDKNMRGALSFNDYDEAIARYVSPVVRSPVEGYISLNVTATNIHTKKITFGINDSDVQKSNASLLFLSDVFENDVRVQGLPRHNILYQYTNDLHQWTIEYQYSVNESLNLTCVSKGLILVEKLRFQWEFNGETSISEALLSSTTLTVSKETFTKILDATHNGKTINCVYIPNTHYSKRVSVEIILRLKLGAKSGEIPTRQTLSDVKISAKSFLLILASSIGAVFVILGLTGLAFLYVRTRNTGRNIEPHYGHVSYQNNTPTPQNTYECGNYNEANRENYYETPGSAENEMDPEDHHYTEIDLKVMKHKLVVPNLVYSNVPSFQNNLNF